MNPGLNGAKLRNVWDDLLPQRPKGVLPLVPEGRSDRSLARSAWDRAAPKEPSRRVRCDLRRCAHPFDFSIGIWQVHESVHVLEQQLEHHRTRTFQKEDYLASLRNTAHIWREIALGLAATDQTVPYGTALWGGVVPGTSCQATISLSLRDKSDPPIQDSPQVSSGRRTIPNSPYLRAIQPWAKLSWPFGPRTTLNRYNP